MTLTVASLVDRPDLGLTLLAAREAAESAPVDWAHAIDRADTGRWIARGTLVLTSGFQLPDDEAGQVAYVDALRRAGACAVAVDTGGRWDRVPDAIVDRGAEIGFPVLAVDADAPFTTVVRTVAEEISAIRERRLAELVSAQSELVEVILRGGVPPVLAELESVIGGRSLVLNNRGTVLASADGSRDDPERRLEHVPAPPYAPAVAKSPLLDRGMRMIHPLTGVSASPGVLVVDAPYGFDETSRLLINHAAAIISLSMARSVAVHETEERLRRDAMRRVLGGDVPEREQLALFGLSPASRVSALVIRNSSATSSRLADELSGLGCSFLCEPRLMGFAVIHDGPDDVAEHLSAVLSAPGRPMVVGVGEKMPLPEASVSLRQAELAASRIESGIRRIGDLPAHELLLGVLDESAAEILTGGLLRRLSDHDARTGEQTVAAAVAFLEGNGRYEAMARKLGVHRQTARSRAERVEQVLGASLDDPDVRAELWLALRSRGDAAR